MRIVTLAIVLVTHFNLCIAGSTEDIIKALNFSSADQLSVFFDSNIDLKILEKENIFSKAQAKVMVKDFFTNHKVSSVTLNHQGGPDNACFAICNLSTTNGDYRLYFLLKRKNGKQLIQKLRIEKDG